MKQIWVVCALLVASALLGGCNAGGDVSASAAENSYKEQEKKAEELAKKNGETPTADPSDQ